MISQPQAPTRTATSTRSLELHSKALQFLPGGTSRLVHEVRPHPTYVSHGNGCSVVDVDGNERIDFFGNASSMIHGYAHPRITDAVIERVRKGTAFALPSEVQITLAEMISSRIASVEQVRFTNSGSEAVLFAVKAVRAFTGRPKIAKFEGLYHGCYDWVEVSLDPGEDDMGPVDSPRSVAYARGLPADVLTDVIVLPFNDLERTEALLRRHRNELAGVLVDVMPNQIGLVPAVPGLLERLAVLTRELGILLVSDEVINFRLAYGGGQEHARFSADVTVLGKVIGGGLPVGAVGASAEIMSVFSGAKGRPAVPHAGTFNANPVTLAAGVESLTLLTRAELGRINALGQRIRDGLTELFTAKRVDAHVTGAGSLFRIHMTSTRFSDYRGWRRAVMANATAKQKQQLLYEGLLDRGILFSPSGMGAISTPMSEREVDVFVDAARDIVAAHRWDA